MKIKYIIPLFLFALSCNNKTELVSGESTSTPIPAENDDSIYTVVEEMPRFPGCEDRPNAERQSCSDQKLLQYIYKHQKFDPIAKKQEVVRTIVATFVIEKDGSISNIEIIKGKGYTNIIEVLEKMPKWKPGKNRGAFKRVRFNLPMRIHFQ